MTVTWVWAFACCTLLSSATQKYPFFKGQWFISFSLLLSLFFASTGCQEEEPCRPHTVPHSSSWPLTVILHLCTEADRDEVGSTLGPCEDGRGLSHKLTRASPEYTDHYSRRFVSMTLTVLGFSWTCGRVIAAGDGSGYEGEQCYVTGPSLQGAPQMKK